MLKGNGKYLLTIAAVWIVLMIGLVNSEPVDQYISVIKRETAPRTEPVSVGEDQLLRKIEEWKRELDEAPVDARVDRVWKAIPGYNGRSVNVQASLARMKETGRQTKEELVFHEIPPKVTLESLGVQPVYRGNEKKRAVSFMINVAWGNEHLTPILDILDQYHIKTTFFLDGSWVKKYPELAREIAKRGHEIGNHAYSHPDMSRIGRERIRQEIGRTQAIIEKAVGVKPMVFTPPSGAYTMEVVRIAKEEFGMQTVLWSADTVDWKEPGPERVLQRVVPKLDSGVIVLMHPTSSTRQSLASLIEAAKNKNLQITTMSQLLSSKRID